MLITATVCAVLMTVALFRKKASAACVSALGAGTALLLWHNDHPLTGTAMWNTLLALTGVMLVLNCFKRTRRVIGLFAYILLTGFVLWQGLGSVGALILFGVAAIVALLRARKSTVLSTAALIVVAGLGLGVAAAPSFVGTAVAAEQPGDPHSLTIQPGDLLPDEAKCDTSNTMFNRNSMAGTKGRLWTDSVSTPFVSKDKDAQFKELTSEICVNPTLGDAYVQTLSDAHIGDFSVAKANPWLGDFTTKSSSKDGLKVWLVKSSDGKTIHVTADYQSNAQLVNALLFALDNQGTKTAPSTANWPLGALVADTLPRVHKESDAKKQETLPFMALTYTQKSGGCPYVLGVNLKDKRPENVSCETAVKVAPKKPTPPRLTVTPPGKGGSTPTPSTTPTKPGSTPSPTPTPSHTPSPSCPPGYTGKPGHCLEQKDGKPIPTNSDHTPGTVTESAKPPVHPSQPATPTKTSGGESTQTAEGSTPKPTSSETAPHAGNPTSTATACVPDPDSGKTC